MWHEFRRCFLDSDPAFSLNALMPAVKLELQPVMSSAPVPSQERHALVQLAANLSIQQLALRAVP